MAPQEGLVTPDVGSMQKEQSGVINGLLSLMAYWGALMPPPLGCAVVEVFVGYTQPCLRMVSWWLKISL